MTDNIEEMHLKAQISEKVVKTLERSSLEAEEIAAILLTAAVSCMCKCLPEEDWDDAIEGAHKAMKKALATYKLLRHERESR